MDLPTESYDWFRPTIKGKNSKKFDYDDFIASLNIQINRKIEKEKSFYCNNKYFIKEKKIILERPQFDQLSEKYSDFELKYYPMLTFHSSKSIDKINSISKYGYLLVGDEHPRFGWTLNMRLGNIYGDGIYSSNNFDVSQWYSFLDLKESFSIIINIVFIGEYKSVDPSNWYDEKKYKSMVKNNEADTFIPIHYIDHYEDAVTPDKRYDTLFSKSMDIIVSGDKNKIIPAVVLTMSPNTNDELPGMNRYYQVPSSNTLSHPKDFFRQLIEADEDEKKKRVQMYHIIDDYYLVDISRLKSQVLERQTVEVNSLERYIFCVPTAPLNRDTTKALGVSNFIETISDSFTKIGFFYDHRTIQKSLSKGNFAAHLASIDFTNDELLLQCLRAVFEYLVRHEYDSQTQLPFSNTLFVMVNEPTESLVSATVNDLFKEFRIPNLDIKLIFLKKLDSNNASTNSLTLDYFAGSSYYCDLDSLSISTVLDEVMDDNFRSNAAKLQRLWVPFPLGVIGEGFLESIEQSPSWDIRMGSDSIVFKGANEYFRFYDGNLYAVEYGRLPLNDPEFFGRFYGAVIPLLSKFKIFTIQNPERCRYYKDRLHAITKSLLSYIDSSLASLETRLSTPMIDEDPNVKQAASVNLSSFRTIKAMVIRLLSDTMSFGNISLKGPWLNQLFKMKFGKSLTKRIDIDANIEAFQDASVRSSTYRNLRGSEAKSAFRSDPLTALVMNLGKLRGFLIRTRVTSASEVEPWNLIVEYISNDQDCLRKVLLQNERDLLYRDSHNKRISDVLLLDNTFPQETQSALYQSYCSYVFTRSPYLYISTQPMALLVNSWSCAIEMAFKKVMRKVYYRETASSDEIAELLRTTFELTKTLERVVVLNPSAMQLMIDLLKEKVLSTELIKRHHIVSLNQILSIFLLPSMRDYVNSPDWDDLCRSLLVETSIRTSRTRLRSTKKSSEYYIMDALGMTFSTSLVNYVLDVPSAIRKTNSFFLNQFSNCTFFTVVGVTGFIEHYLRGEGLEEIAKAFINGDISMKAFLVKHFNTEKSRLVQLALYLYGMKYAYSNQRDLSFDDPLQVKASIVNEYFQYIQSKQKLLHKLSFKAQQRLEMRMEKAEPFVSYHQMPNLFSEHQVAEMNRSRPSEDQLERLSNGLLKFHCCYPDCPQYLQRFVSRKDAQNIKNGKRETRYGLMNHLQYDCLNNNYVKNFHSMAFCYASKLSFEEFEARMKFEFKDNLSFKHSPNIEDHLKDVWEKYHHLRL